MMGFRKADDQERIYVAMWSQPRDEGGMGSTEVTTAQGMKHTRKETNNQKKVLEILLSLSWK